MKKELNLLQKSKRFFSPLQQDTMVYINGMFVYFSWGVDRVIHVLFLERIIHFLELMDIEMFNKYIKIYLLYIIIYTIVQIITRKKGWVEIRETAIQYIQNIYLKKFVNLNNNHVEKYGTGKLTAIINKGIDRWGASIDIFLGQSINVLVSFTFTAYMLYKSNDLFLVGFVFIYIFFYVCSYFLNLGALKYRRMRRDQGNHHTKDLVKVIMNKQEILQSDKINHELETLDSYKKKEIFYNRKIADFLQPLFEGPNIILSVLILGLIWYLGESYLAGDMTLATIVGVVSALILMKSAIERGIAFFKDFTKDFIDIDKLWDFFDNSPQLLGYDKGDKFIYKSGDIVLKDIDYAYIEGKNVLKNFSINIAGGKITAFVGDSGGGKSTIVKLIGGYIQHENGDLIIDNQNIKDISLKSYYKNIGYLTQEPTVFDGTILENLTYSIDEIINEEQIDEIIKMAKCEFIYDLAKGVNTEIGEKGIKLSGGQRQRLAIAKIMLKNPKIIILDEPTSALDSFSEEQITKAMHNLFIGRTVIIIAHRLQTVKNADNIYVINQGKIIEEGTHKNLVKKGGKYAKMLELQSGF